MKIVVVGGNGQLGTDLCVALNSTGHEIIEVNHAQTDVADLNGLKKKLDDINPHVVVNTAAMHNLDACEEDPAKSFAVNGIGARNLAQLANELGFILMHISTDYVFDGLKLAPYDEKDCPGPLNVYGNTKLAGEYFIQSIAKKYFIVRVSGIYGKNPCRAKGGLNFVALMLKLAKERDEIRVVDDEILTPTYTVDIANQIIRLLDSDDYGLYHATAQDSCSWYQFAAKIFEFTGIETKLNIAGPGEFPAKVPRPKYSVLENQALQSIGLDIMPHWEDGLKRYLETIKGQAW